MPFDGTITDFVAPDLTTPSVEALIYILEHPETWPKPGGKPWHWDFSTVKSGHHCGTAGCAAGIATQLWGMSPSITKLSQRLGIKSLAAMDIFAAGSAGSDITAGDVANRLRDWQAGRTIRWK